MDRCCNKKYRLEDNHTVMQEASCYYQAQCWFETRFFQNDIFSTLRNITKISASGSWRAGQKAI